MGDPWTVPEVEDLQRSIVSTFSGISPSGWWKRPPVAAPPIASPGAGPGPAPITAPTGGGRRRALCIGIDRSPVKPLAGCVRDAQLWAKTLRRFGFESELLLDGDATYANIGAQLERLIRTSRSGDVIVWQYSGHGTQVPDVNRDEAGGDSPGQDEAICPVDLQTGRMFVDDQIAALIAQLPSGVAFTLIMDCCHSGTLNRFGFGEPPDGSVLRDERARFLPLTDDLKQAYLRFAREEEGGARGLKRSRTRAAIQQTNEVLFTACLSTEVAWESNGQGEFTVRATRLLEERGPAVTNEEFINGIIRAFGPNPRQTPTIACAAALRGKALFAPQGDGAQREVFSTEAAQNGRGGPAAEANGFGRLADALETVARELRRS
jgi:caspase domain-containing protein